MLRRSRLHFRLIFIGFLLVLTLIFQGLSLRELNRMSAMIQEMSQLLDERSQLLDQINK